MAADDLTPERALAVSYAPRPSRPALTALLELDRRLGGILRTTREPLIGQMRLSWWREALLALEPGARLPAEPVLAALHADLLPRGINGGELAAVVDGWEAIIGSESLCAAAMTRMADERGAGLFAIAARLLDARDTMTAAAGRGWSLADLSCGLSDPAAASRSAALARHELDEARGRWSRAGRALGALTASARADLAGIPVGSPRRVARLLALRLTGW